MLLLGSRLLNSPVMSLQTGTRLAHILRPLIDPANLRILAYEVDGPLLTEKPSYLRTADIREYGRLGMIINSADEFVGADDIIQIKNLLNLGFALIGVSVLDEQGRKLGKVEDYTLETGDFVIQQLTVRRGLLKSLADTGLLIHRSQIVEINNKSIIVKANDQKISKPVMTTLREDFVNPFRTAGAKPETITTNTTSDS